MEPALLELRVFHLAEDLAIRIHAMSLQLPTFERFEEAQQIRRSSKRVVANIIEGHAQRKYKALYLSYLYRAVGSSEETEGHLRLLHKTGSLADAAEFQSLSQECSELSRRLFSFVQSIERRHDRPHFLDALQSSDDLPPAEDDVDSLP